MEARKEKLMQARASFQSQGSSFSYSIPAKSRESEQKDARRDFRHISLIVRIFLAIGLFIIYICAMEMDSSKINEFARKSNTEIQKNQIIIEKCSNELGKIW